MKDKKKVLFVDDNKMDRLILSKILDQLDLDFRETQNADEFLHQVKSYAPDLCLIDLNLQRPNDGKILVRALRNILGHELPIIVISAIEDSSEIALNIQNGANDFICKPIDKSLLSSKISNYLQNPTIQSRRLPLFKIPSNIDANIQMDINLKMTSISEEVITFVSDIFLVSGATLKLKNTFFQDIFSHIEYFNLKIEHHENDIYKGKILNFTDEDLPKIRRHLSSLQKLNNTNRL